jgi:hypothetical protein
MIAIRSLHAPRPVPPCCATCVHFDDRPAAIEAAMAGLRSLGSAFAAVRADDGLCRHLDRYLAADRWCEDHEPGVRPAGA